jgi:gamma-tubulin complex component 5
MCPSTPINKVAWGDKLVLIRLTKFQFEPARFNAHRESALRALRYHNYPRTNQFEVASNLEGLQEKFRVYNEDPLADALHERLDRLASFEVKLGPEILSLLLELSDKPVIKSRLEDLDLLKEPDPDPGPPLRWKDLIADNPGSYDKYLWYVKKRSIVPEYMPRLDGHWG